MNRPIDEPVGTATSGAGQPERATADLRRLLAERAVGLVRLELLLRVRSSACPCAPRARRCRCASRDAFVLAPGGRYLADSERSRRWTRAIVGVGEVITAWCAPMGSRAGRHALEQLVLRQVGVDYMRGAVSKPRAVVNSASNDCRATPQSYPQSFGAAPATRIPRPPFRRTRTLGSVYSRRPPAAWRLPVQAEPVRHAELLVQDLEVSRHRRGGPDAVWPAELDGAERPFPP